MHSRFLIPVPRELKFLPGCHFLNDKSLFAAPNQYRQLILKLSEQYWKIHPEFQPVPEDKSCLQSRCSFRVGTSGIELDVHSEIEVRQVFQTLRQMAEPERGVYTSSRQIIPCVEVTDYPSLSFRGFHLLYHEETTEIQLEKMIRLAAACKYNYVVLEFCGTFPYEQHPEFQWESKKGNRPFVKHLIELSRDLGIILIPEINLLGHASCTGVGSVKHVVLDRFPEYGPLFEPDGWTWCLSNPWVRRVQAEMLEEVLDMFGPVPYFHLGFDEAFNAAVCSECSARSFPELLLDHILFLHDLLKKHQARMILWHDMFLELDQSKWGDNIIMDRNRENPHEILEKLPRDIVLADWHYNEPKEGLAAKEQWPTADYFSSLGFSVLLSPWRDERGILSMAEKAADCRLDGMLQTTWNVVCGSDVFRKYFFVAPNKMWNRNWNPEIGFADEMEAVGRLLRMITHDMNLSCYDETGAYLKKMN